MFVFINKHKNGFIDRIHHVISFQVFVGDQLCGEIAVVDDQASYQLDCGGLAGESVKVEQSYDTLSLCEVQVFGWMQQSGEWDFREVGSK